MAQDSAGGKRSRKTASMTPTSTKSSSSEHTDNDQFMQAMRQRGLFLNMVLNMTWQLAIVVIIPIVGGYYLDQHFHLSPILTIAGALVALLGFSLVLWRVVKVAGVKAEAAARDTKKDKS